MQEIEIKYTIKDLEHKNTLLEAVKKMYSLASLKKEAIVRSYFYEQITDKKLLKSICIEVLTGEHSTEALEIIDNCGDLMIKARSIDGQTYFALKGAKDGEDAVHAISRRELEVEMSEELEVLNETLTQNDAKLVSKWYSEREYYELDDTLSLQIEFLSGYGYKAEIEIVTEPQNADQATKSIKNLGEKLQLDEISQKQLGRMYAYYNDHWEEYYDTRKVFSTEVWNELLGG